MNITLTYEQYRTIADALIRADVYMGVLATDYRKRGQQPCAEVIEGSVALVEKSRKILRAAYDKGAEESWKIA